MDHTVTLLYVSIFNDTV